MIKVIELAQDDKYRFNRLKNITLFNLLQIISEKAFFASNSGPVNFNKLLDSYTAFSLPSIFEDI